MSIIIRPIKGVFQRSLPLLVVFGAYRRFDLDRPLARCDLDTLTRAVELARTLRMSLAFSRVIDDANGAGAWLPGCRPRITDRVFDHPAGSCFQNREFSSVFNGITEREIYTAGARDDSSMQASVAEMRGHQRPLKVIVPDHPLQICSTLRGNPMGVFRASPYSGTNSDISVSEWGNRVCGIQYQNT